LLMTPVSTGPEQMPDTMEAKMTSGIRALVRTCAEKNGHNKAVVEAMIDKTKELRIDGEVLNEKGQILTLTNVEAEKQYGQPPKPLLSAGTFESLDALLAGLGYSGAARLQIAPTGAEQLAFWINWISPVLLIIGIVGLYIEFKTPGFGLPGIIGLVAFGVYFLGSYVGGLSGMEWPILFGIGLALVVVEIILFPGIAIVALAGAALALIAIIMATVDVYPGAPIIPTMAQLRVPVQHLLVAMGCSVLVAIGLSRFLPKTAFYHNLVSESVSGGATISTPLENLALEIGAEGVALSVLRPSGKARFGDQVCDVMTQGEMLTKDQRVRIIGSSGSVLIVEAVG